jgi:hypothetical protein
MRRWFAFIASLTVVVVAGVAFGFSGSGYWTGNDGGSDPIEFDVPTTTEPDEKPEDQSFEEPKYEESPWYADGSDYEAGDGMDKDEVTEVTEPKDTFPPDLQILHPVNGQVFETKEVVFEGVTEPGARVFAGQYEADVNDDGGWRIVLILSPGGNHATLKAKDAAGNISQASVSVTYAVPEKELPKEEDPKEWEFSAHQVYGECSESPPNDVFYGTGKPGSTIWVLSEYGSGETKVDEHGEWEIKVFFPESPIGQGILVKAKDEFGHKQSFEFTHTD